MSNICELLVLIFVGFIASAYAQDACVHEIGQWVSKTPCPFVHIEGAKAVLNNKLYLFSGFYVDAQYVAPNNIGGLVTSHRLDIYDPTKDEWTVGADTPFTASHTQAAVWENPPSGSPRYIYVAGGFEGPPPAPALKQVWRYDTLTDSYARVADLPSERASGGLTIDKNHRLHYIGGLKDRDNDSSDHWFLDLTQANAEWVSAADLPRKRNHFPAFSIQDYIYVTGGQFKHDSVPVDTALSSAYSISDNTWRELSNMPAPRTHVEPANIVANGRVILFGGRNNQGPGPVILSTIVEYNPQSDTWTQLKNLPRQGIALVVGYFRGITVDGSTGDYVVITAGGIDWNIESPSTWIARIGCSCCQVVDPPPAPQPSVVPTPTETVASESIASSSIASSSIPSVSTPSGSVSQAPSSTGSSIAPVESIVNTSEDLEPRVSSSTGLHHTKLISIALSFILIYHLIM